MICCLRLKTNHLVHRKVHPKLGFQDCWLIRKEAPLAKRNFQFPPIGWRRTHPLSCGSGKNLFAMLQKVLFERKVFLKAAVGPTNHFVHHFYGTFLLGSDPSSFGETH